MQEYKTTLYQVIGKRIRARREYLKISQVSLSMDLGLSRSSLSNIEVGRHQTPLHIIYRIAELLTIEVTDLIPSPKEIIDFTDNNELKIFLDKNNLSKETKKQILKLYKSV